MKAGDMVTANLRLERVLGEGGMGMVWLARNVALDADVAVKFITHDYAQNLEVRTRFRREAAMVARVKSPHIVQVFDHGEAADGSVYIVMDLLQGEELAQRLEREGALAPADVVVIVHQAAKGLARAHQAGIVHRDIKPANIFLVDNGDGEIFVKILDFGIAKLDTSEVPSSMTATGASLGTPYYMSPEQVTSSKSADLRTDLWSLAVVAYECLTGVRPFAGETLGALWIGINNGAFAPASTLRPSLPRSLDAWFLRAFATAREERYQSAREFSDALRAALPTIDRSRVGDEEHTGQFPLVSVAPPPQRPLDSNGRTAMTLVGDKIEVPLAARLPAGMNPMQSTGAAGEISSEPELWRADALRVGSGTSETSDAEPGTRRASMPRTVWIGAAIVLLSAGVALYLAVSPARQTHSTRPALPTPPERTAEASHASELPLLRSLASSDEQLPMAQQPTPPVPAVAAATKNMPAPLAPPQGAPTLRKGKDRGF
jgi:eukaryotic-like serine/threonine-protein kinase